MHEHTHSHTHIHTHTHIGGSQPTFRVVVTHLICSVPLPCLTDGVRDRTEARRPDPHCVNELTHCHTSHRHTTHQHTSQTTLSHLTQTHHTPAHLTDNTGAHLQQTRVGAHLQQTRVGAHLQQTRVGAHLQQTRVGAHLQQTRVFEISHSPLVNELMAQACDPAHIAPSQWKLHYGTTKIALGRHNDTLSLTSERGSLLPTSYRRHARLRIAVGQLHH